MNQTFASHAPSCSLDHWFSSETQLGLLYPPSIRALSARHWTPLEISKKVAGFLAPGKKLKVLDIGSGAGKFCLAAAYYEPSVEFYGVEQRKHLVAHAETAKSILGIKNVHFLHQNITQLDFKQFDHFYFYNSFYENLNDTEKIDGSVTCSPHLYSYYYRCLYKKLEELPAGTRLATYHTISNKIPPDFHLVEDHVGQLLSFRMKF